MDITEQILLVDIIPDPAVRKAMNEINAGLICIFIAPLQSQFSNANFIVIF